MSKTKDTKKKLISKIQVIQKVADNPITDTVDKVSNFIESRKENTIGKKLGDLIDKKSKKQDNTSDIFSDLVEIADSFLNKNKKVPDPTKFDVKNSLKTYAVQSAKKTVRASKQIFLDNVKKVFFGGDGICGSNGKIKVDNIEIEPSEFDFLNILTVSPNTSVGSIIYEPTQLTGKEKVNKNLYNMFAGDEYQFDAISDRTLFTSKWDTSNQVFGFSGLTQGGSVTAGQFLGDYFATMEMPDEHHILKTVTMLTLQGGDGDNLTFSGSINDLMRMLNKLFASCGESNTVYNKTTQNKNTTTQFNENDQDDEFYFDFNNVDGIDLDGEQDRIKKVLRFRDCNDFIIPVNKNTIEDFVYLSKTKLPDTLINSTLSNAASSAYDESDGTIPLLNFNLSIMNLFIVNVPRALIMSILSPKLFLPIVILYKVFKANVKTLVKDLMKKLSKLFTNIIKDIFWFFIREFWKFLKKDLLDFVLKIAAKILYKKKKRYIDIITSLINLLIKLLESGIDNCFDLFNTILNVITLALKGGQQQKIPPFLLSFANLLPGYSPDRAYINVIEKLEAQGIPTSPLYGEKNDILSLVKGIIDGHSEEEDNNGFISASNELFTLPLPGLSLPAVFPPGTMTINGKRM
jgi:hypothetical protein